MRRLTIPSLAALVVMLCATGVQAQQPPTVQMREQIPAQLQRQLPAQLQERLGVKTQEESAGEEAAGPNTEESATPHMHRMPSRMTDAMVMVRIDEIIAANTNEGIDQRLMPLGLRLRSVFPFFSTYRLITRRVGRTRCGKMLAFSLPGGWIVHVQPNSIDGDMIAMHLLLFQGARPLMTTLVKLRNHGTLIVGGPLYQQGTLIIPIGADVPPIALPPVRIPIVPVPPGQ
jgi:hypothetical protein